MTDGIWLGPLLLRWNGILLALGISVGALLAAREAKRRRLDPEIIYYLFLPLLLCGTLGARIWYVFTPPLSSVQLGLTTHYYLSHPLDAIALWQGGFGMPGALVGGVLALLYFVNRNDLSFWELADILAPGLALAQAIGRLGNYFNQELYGLPTSLPWRLFIQPAYRLAGFQKVEYFHPLFAYEVILNFANLFFLTWFARNLRNSLKNGDVFLVYLGLYSGYRFLLEYLRLDVSLINGINANQVFFGLLFISVASGLYLRHRYVREL
jgi:phosphatidylglycerol:prolipoprotein diacylglycerol transferase